MTKSPAKTIEIKLERTIPAPPLEVHDAWLDPKVPGNPGHEGGWNYFLGNFTKRYEGASAQR